MNNSHSISTQKTTSNFSETFADRFWKKVNKSGGCPAHIADIGECWIWMASKTHGYGQIQRGGRQGKAIRAHQASWIIHHGDIPTGIFVCHKCDNRACVNPDHLFLGTRMDNIQDCVSKGRNRGNCGFGEKSRNHKLTQKIADEIKSLYPMLSQRKLAKRFGVCQGTINCVVNGIRWSHVNGH